MNAIITDTPAGPRIHVPMNLKRRSGRKRIILPDGPDVRTLEAAVSARATYRDAMVIAVARAFRWKMLLDEGKYASICEMANDLGVERAYMARLMRLTCLAPGIIEAIVDGGEPEDMSLKRLCQPMPSFWQDQTRQLRLCPAS